MAAAWLRERGQGLIGRQAGRDQRPDLRRDALQPLGSSVAKANGTPPWPGRPRWPPVPSIAPCGGPGASEGSSCSSGRPLAVLLLGRDLGLLGSIETKHDSDPLGLEPVDDLGGLAAPHDHGGGAELLGQVECPVDLVAGIGLPPDRQLPVPRLPEGTKRRVVGGSLLVLP